MKSKILENSILLNTNYDYVDGFRNEVVDKEHKLCGTDLGKAFFKSSPKWVRYLFSFRNKIMGVFGVKTENTSGNDKQIVDNFKCEIGEKIGLFEVFDKNEREVILGADDKHLNFRVSLYIEDSLDLKREITITTTVKFNNIFGKIYFFPVKPFHKLIVPSMLKSIIKNLETK